jgi:hypothetical protein
LGGTAAVYNEYVPSGATKTREMLLTANAATYEPSETDSALEQTIRLPSGGVSSEYDPRIGETIHHGHGWRYIHALLPALTTHQIEGVLRSPNGVVQTESGIIVVGDSPMGDGSLLLYVSGGTIMYAAVGEVYRDPLGQPVQLPVDKIEKIRKKHPEIGQTEEEIQETVRQIIENPDEVYVDPDGFRMYIKRINGQIIFLLVSPTATVMTAYAPSSSGGYSEERAIRYIKRQIEKHGFTKIHEENKIIDVDAEGGVT